MSSPVDRSLILYGLAHCSTCQKARADLEEHGWHVAFRDVQADPLTKAQRASLVAAFGDRLVNRASLTWRGMSEAERADDPVAMLEAKPSVMKRPVIVAGDLRLSGWTAKVKRALGVPA